MEKTIKFLRWTFCIFLVSIALLVVVLFLLRSTALSKDTYVVNYLLSVLGIISPMISIYVALKIYKFPFVRKYLFSDNVDSKQMLKRYAMCYVLRLLLLAMSCEYNVIIYAFNSDTSYALCALISVLGFSFLWPTIDRMKLDLGLDNE